MLEKNCVSTCGSSATPCQLTFQKVKTDSPMNNIWMESVSVCVATKGVSHKLVNGEWHGDMCVSYLY